MQIRPVSTPRDLREFIELPYRLYRDDPIWVPPLRSEQRSQFDQKRNPFLDHCKRQLFLLEDEGEIIGRIAAFVDTLATEFWGERVGLFGYFECTENPAAAQLLLDAARDWLQANQCSTMRGPWSFVSQEWGLLVEGFVPSPVIMTPYNPSYYCDFMTDFGLHKIKDQLSWYVSFAEGYVLPERILTLTDAVAKRYGIRIRGINMRQYDREVENIMELSNASIIDNWGYSPVTEAEVRAMARDMRPYRPTQGRAIRRRYERPANRVRHCSAGHQQPARTTQWKIVPIWLPQAVVGYSTPAKVPHVWPGCHPRVSGEGR